MSNVLTFANWIAVAILSATLSSKSTVVGTAVTSLAGGASAPLMVSLNRDTEGAREVVGAGVLASGRVNCRG
ncbi:hypothetical protein JYU34_002071 [Plutella xylostella]|uniref:Uncharacterized protein n=1 Tax=Plutella xylostella TaxID=51655 RepID=A0ABQ7R5L2_PLUXY|nr:hypothetical protein JYU34_002071 [Plutella xylostella]